MALTMQGLARRTQMASPEEVFSVGLLAGIGELALATLHAESYGDVLAQAADADSIEALIAVERAAYATDRVELGQHLLADWTQLIERASQVTTRRQRLRPLDRLLRRSERAGRESPALFELSDFAEAESKVGADVDRGHDLEDRQFGDRRQSVRGQA